ncbi:unnamed protein product [Clonostachys rhizophaga]|uniref:Serine/arginine repetitive matrix protein 1 n=1 Tax=Clonostachys rhizophaga TaxID=160324 RepID=A0A9N9VN94_9HYPO|nr:unnamed protein product [Clonostachys rhizophaga]
MPRSGPSEPIPGVKSPPRGPAALRPPTGPAANRTLSANSTPAHTSKHPPPHNSQPNRAEMPSPTQPPAGPRGYIPPARGAYASRGRGGTWSQPTARHLSTSVPSPSTPTGPSNAPTGPRSSSNGPTSSTPIQARPFNPPTGPAAGHGGGPRQTLAQSLLATMPPIIPGGKLDPSMTPLILGVTRDLEPHFKKLRDEEEKYREELRIKQERVRKSLYHWDRLGREAKAWEMRSDLSEKSMKNLAGEGMGGAAF